MLKVISDTVWMEIRRLANKSATRWGAVAYVSSDSAIRFGEGDLLVVDASDGAIQTGQTSAKVLRDAFSRGADVFSLTALHAKVLAFDKTVFVGSANISANSARLHESGVLSDDPRMVSGAIQLIKLFAAAGARVDERFLTRIESMPVSKRKFGQAGQVRSQDITLSTNRAWIVGLPKDVTYPGEKSIVDEVASTVAHDEPTQTNVDWFWWRGQNKFSRLAKEGDLFVSLFRPRKDIRSPRTVRVYPPVSIRHIFKEDGVTARTYHFSEPEDAEERSLSWADFARLLKRAGINRRLSVDSCFEISENQIAALLAMWPK